MKNFIYLTLFCWFLIISGCGGGGGSSGIPAITPGGSGGGGAVVTPLVSGWNTVKSGSSDYTAAKTSFNSVISSSTASSAEKSSARAGLGFIDIREKGVSTASVSEFLEALSLDPTNKDAKVGISMVYLTKTGNEEVTYLESMGLSDVNYVYQSSNLSITNAEAHALMALAYYESGRYAESSAQITKARQLEGSNLTVDQIYNSLQTLGFSP